MATGQGMVGVGKSSMSICRDFTNMHLKRTDLNDPSALVLYNQVFLFKNNNLLNNVEFAGKSNKEQNILHSVAHGLGLEYEYSLAARTVRICRPTPLDEGVDFEPRESTPLLNSFNLFENLTGNSGGGSDDLQGLPLSENYFNTLDDNSKSAAQQDGVSWDQSAVNTAEHSQLSDSFAFGYGLQWDAGDLMSADVACPSKVPNPELQYVKFCHWRFSADLTRNQSQSPNLNPKIDKRTIHSVLPSKRRNSQRSLSPETPLRRHIDPAHLARDPAITDVEQYELPVRDVSPNTMWRKCANCWNEKGIVSRSEPLIEIVLSSLSITVLRGISLRPMYCIGLVLYRRRKGWFLRKEDDRTTAL